MADEAFKGAEEDTNVFAGFGGSSDAIRQELKSKKQRNKDRDDYLRRKRRR